MSNPTARWVDREGASVALDQWLTVDEVAAWLKVNKHWVYEHTRSQSVPAADRLPHIKIGKYLRFDPEAIRAFVARHAQGR